MPNAFTSLAVPAGNGVGASSGFFDRLARTFCVGGTFEGIVVLEGSPDDIEWTPLATFEGPDFKTLIPPIFYVRVRRKNVPVGLPPGLPVVTAGADATSTDDNILTPPVALNGPGTSTNTGGMSIQGISVVGAFSNRGMVVHVEISQDGVSWVSACPAFARPGTILNPVSAQHTRMRVAGRVFFGPIPTVSVFGPNVPVCSEDLPLPALNGPGTPVDTAECGIDKTVSVFSPDGDVPCRILVEGSNDAGTTWVPVMGWNTTGMKKLLAIFQQMRVTVIGLAQAVAGMTVGIAAPRAVCDPVEEGESETDVSEGGV